MSYTWAFKPSQGGTQVQEGYPLPNSHTEQKWRTPKYLTWSRLICVCIIGCLCGYVPVKTNMLNKSLFLYLNYYLNRCCCLSPLSVQAPLVTNAAPQMSISSHITKSRNKPPKYRPACLQQINITFSFPCPNGKTTFIMQKVIHC